MIYHCERSLNLTNMDGLYNQFIDKYIRTVNHSCFLVYLYALRHRNDENVSPCFFDIACSLNMVIGDVRFAFSFWQREGIAEILNDDSALLTFGTQSCTVDFKSFEPIRSDTGRDESLRELYEEVSRILNVDISSNDIRTIYSIYEDLKIEPHMILALAARAKEKNRGIPYVEKTAVKWKSMGIDSIEKADAFFLQEDQSTEKIKKSKGRGAAPKASKFSNFQQRDTSYKMLEDLYLKNVYDEVCTKEE